MMHFCLASGWCHFVFGNQVHIVINGTTIWCACVTFHISGFRNQCVIVNHRSMCFSIYITSVSINYYNYINLQSCTCFQFYHHILSVLSLVTGLHDISYCWFLLSFVLLLMLVLPTGSYCLTTQWLYHTTTSK